MTFLYILGIIAAILLILVILIQNPKGGGLASNFSSSNSVLGVQKTTEIIEKMTWGLAAVILVVALTVTMNTSTPVPGDNVEPAGTILENTDIPAPTAPPQNAQPAPGEEGQPVDPNNPG